MALSINTNVASLNAQRNLGASQSSLGTAMQRLSSGMRINSAKDDAAGLAISNRMTSQVRGLNQAVRNANDGISLAQTAEGALQETTNLLQRMRELAVQSSNGTNTTEDQKSLDAEFQQLITEIDRIATDTSFNNQVLLAGGFSGASNAMVFQIGADAAQTIAVEIAGAGAGALSVNGLNVLTFSAAQSAITQIDSAIGTVDTSRGDLGAVQNRLESTIANLQNVSENVSAARSRILDADIAQETSSMTKYNILQQAGVSILAQANQAPQLALSLLG
ncbi:flagellin [Geoalkalibacter ferrihydriticus]|uniref:Flagellin n=2 Tax=Geoalkalibacter ferrihydriticus TaxID=392333 RepID=A0A0C2DQL5_9BACT|nr:flagellin [Geoalkalibacter ferrihydriticus]KIH75709.1 flagellin [Geoalkalibacter ferrihydriticus DSM 17813]SDM75067.1 flagellin [Geoalkalibacter ferrihydriticus]